MSFGSKKPPQPPPAALPQVIPSAPYLRALPGVDDSYKEPSPSGGAMGSGRLMRPEFHPSLCRIIIERVRLQGDIHRAACSLGIPYTKVSSWLLRGTKDDGTPEWPLYKEFLLRVEGALSEYESRLIEVIHNTAMEGDWKAATWLLERNNPEKWGGPAMHKRKTVNLPEQSPAESDAWWTSNAPLVHRELERAGSRGAPVLVDSPQGTEEGGKTG